jgi:hypothetical protein
MFAELTQELFSHLDTAKYVKTEYRVSVYGRYADDTMLAVAWYVGTHTHGDAF